MKDFDRTNFDELMPLYFDRHDRRCIRQVVEEDKTEASDDLAMRRDLDTRLDAIIAHL
jgi:hypothetical protein